MSEPGTRSTIALARHIILVRVARVELARWEPEDKQTQKRRAQLDLVLERVLKGTTDASPGHHVQLAIVQREATGRIVDVSGAWSGIELRADARLIAFSNATGTTLDEILTEPALESVVPADSALIDVELAVASETQRLGVSALVERAHGVRDSLGPFFAEYLTGRLSEVLFKDPKAFDRIVSLSEDSRTAPRFQQTFVPNLFSKVLLLEPAPAEFTNRLAVGGSRLIVANAAAPLPSHLIETYLPNLLGLVGSGPPKSASSVFGDFPEDRARLEQALIARRGTPAADRLLAWLHS